MKGFAGEFKEGQKVQNVAGPRDCVYWVVFLKFVQGFVMRLADTIEEVCGSGLYTVNQ